MSLGRFVLAASIAAGLMGCAELPPLEEGVCGNGVIDPGEDCDGVTAFPDQEATACGAPGDGLQACRQVSGGDVVCPAGWGAGADGTCGRANGTFSSSSEVPAGFVTLAVGDSDGDTRPDILGQTFANNIEAWHGDDRGVFGSQAVLSVGTITGSPAFGYLDDLDPATALLDAVVPQALGVFVMRSTPGAGLQPVIFPTFAVDFSSRAIPIALTTAVSLVPAISHGVALFQRGDGTLGLGTLEGDDVAETVTPVATPKRLADLVGSPIHVNLDVGALDPGEPASGREELLFAFEGETRVHAFRFVFDGLGQFLPDALPPLELPAGLRIAQRVDGDEIDQVYQGNAESNGIRVGDLDGDGALDVVVRATVVGPSRQVLVVSFLGNGDGTFRTPFIDTRFDGLRQQAAGCPLAERAESSRWPLALADFTGDGVAEAVGMHGIYYSTPALGFCAITPDLVTWLEATVGDFNDDGLVDVAAVPALSRAIDFRLSTETGLFNRFQVSTENLPGRLRVGDFDGDLISDLALVEIASLESNSGELSILFGDSAGAPNTRVPMGPVADVVTLEPASSPFDFLGIDATTDLYMQSGIGEGATASIMVGSSQRRMLSPLSLSSAGPEEARVPLALQIGRFRDATGVTDATPDVFALALRRASAETPEGIEAWLVPGKDGGDVVVPTLSVAQPFQASLAELATFTEFRVDCASYASGDLGPRTSGDQEVLDEIVAIDTTCEDSSADLHAAPHLQVLYVATEGGGVTLQNFPVTIDASLRSARRPRLADVDADGDLDVVIVFAGDAQGEGRALALYFNQGTVGPEQFVETLVPLGESGNIPIDVAPLNLDADPQREIAVLLPRGVTFFDTDGSTVTELESKVEFRELMLALAAGDVNRDGIDDLLVSGFVQTTVFLQDRFADVVSVTQEGMR